MFLAVVFLDLDRENTQLKKNILGGAREIAQWLGALLFAEDLGLIPGYSSQLSEASVPGDLTPSSDLNRQ